MTQTSKKEEPIV